MSEGNKMENIFFKRVFARAIGRNFLWIQPQDAQKRVLQDYLSHF